MVKLGEKAVFHSHNLDVGVKLSQNVNNLTPVVNFVGFIGRIESSLSLAFDQPVTPYG